MIARAGWTRPTRVVFRFVVVYLGLYSVATQIAGGLFLFPNFSLPSLGTRWPMRNITLWLATRVFHVSPPLLYTGNSGDTLFHWIQTCWLAALAGVVTTVWSRLDRTRPAYDALHAWVRVVLRFALAGQMFYYGLAKVIPTQFPPPSLVTLVEPVGNLSPTDLLWTFVGSSTGYQMFTGWAEVAAGMLLVVPRTASLGALVALADLAQVLALNMAYDFGLKQISFHLILISLVILAPDARRITNVLVGRAAAPASQMPLFPTARASHRALYAQLLVGVYLVAMFARLALVSWHAAGGPGSPRSALYGIWDVDALDVDGQRSRALNDYDRRWRRVIFDAPDRIVFQRLDDSFAHYGASIDADHRRIVLRKGNSRHWAAAFAFERPTADQLILDGEMDDHVIHAQLRRLDLDVFRLLNNGFRWIRPPDPYGG